MPDTSATFVDVLNLDDDLLAHLDGLLFKLRNRHIVVITPLSPTPVAIMLTAEPFDSLGEAWAVVRERTIRHTDTLARTCLKDFEVPVCSEPATLKAPEKSVLSIATPDDPPGTLLVVDEL